jgi:GNAT superfamily N-acetyltransferase
VTNYVLLNPTDAELGVAVEENLHALFRAMASLPGSELAEGPKLSFHHTFPTNPMFKGVWGTRLASAGLDDAIDETIAWFEERDAPFLFWWTGPSTSPAELGKRLAARGLISMEEQTAQLVPGLESLSRGAPGMAADLDAVDENVLQQVPDGFTIEEVRDEAALYDFKRILLESYGMPEFAAQAWVDATLALGIGRTPWRLYLGRLRGEAVATNLVFNGGGVASVYAIATVPAARGKGIGGAITLAPLLEARDEGYRHAVLFSSAMGVHAYERIGFRLIHAWIDRYMWRRA